MTKKPFDTTTFVEYPKQVYSPATCEMKVANNITEIPEGWIDHYPTEAEQGKAVSQPEDAPSPLSRDQLIAALKEGSIQYNNRGNIKELESTLNNALRVTLANKNVAIPVGVTIIDLLKLVGSKVV